MPTCPNSVKKILHAAAMAAILMLAFTVKSMAENEGGKGAAAGAYDERAAQNVVWEEKLKRQVEFLCDSICAGRGTGTRGGTEAAFLITRNFRKAGLLAPGGSYAKSFYTADSLRIGHNIIGILPGSRKKPKDSYIIVGAHYDHLGVLDGRMFPGADNNASGVAALMSLVDMFSSMKTLGRAWSSNIIFVAFDGKELSMSGAESLWKMLGDSTLVDPLNGKAITRDKIRLMVNIDQIGSSLSPLASGREDFIIMLGGESLSKEAMNSLSFCNRFYGPRLEISESYYGSETFTRLFYRLSDQRPFVDNKVPAVLFTSGITLNNNKTYDTPGTLNYPVMRRRIILIYQWLDILL